MGVDLNRIASAAFESFLDDEEQSANRGGRNRRLGGVGAVALGVGLAVAARAAYSRVRQLDLERVAGAVEDKLGG